MIELSAAAGADHISLMLVDDHPLVRDGLRARLGDVPGLRVVGEAGSGQEALAQAAALQPDLILVDVRLPDISGIELTAKLAELVPASRILILSMYDNREYVLSGLRAGARGYVLKDAPSTEIIAAIKVVAAGGTYYSAAVAAALTASNEPATQLTEREREVLILLAQGSSNKRVAQKLDVSVRTVEAHRLNLRRKLNIDSPAGLTKYALEQGWISISESAK
jgi:DNA-binding NarL/FixJ family response regulator